MIYYPESTNDKEALKFLEENPDFDDFPKFKTYEEYDGKNIGLLIGLMIVGILLLNLEEVKIKLWKQRFSNILIGFIMMVCIITLSNTFEDNYIVSFGLNVLIPIVVGFFVPFLTNRILKLIEVKAQ